MLEFTLGIDNIEIEISAETIKLFQQIEDRFRESLDTNPIPELETILQKGAVVTVSFRLQRD